MNTDDTRYDWITEKVIGAAFKVQSHMGSGFAELRYENALAHELRKMEFDVRQQVSLQVWYDGIIVGHYVADLIINGVVLIELKAIKALDTVHAAQCINYLAATKLPLCLLINFGRRVEIKRIAGLSLKTLN